MADIVITSASVVPSAGARASTGVAGVAIAAGKIIHQDAATRKFVLSDADSIPAASNPEFFIAVNSAAVDQPIQMVRSGDVALGAVLTVGEVYILSSTPGGIAPVADLDTGMRPVVLGIAISTSVLRMGATTAPVEVA